MAADIGGCASGRRSNAVRGDGLKHQKEKRSMEHFAGLDVSVKETSVCIVDDTGKIVREVKIASGGASEPAALQAVLKNLAYRVPRPDLSLQKSRILKVA